MKPLLHAKISAHKFGGVPQDYIDIHNWFDQTKAYIPDARHRNVLHNAFGIFLCEQVFGETIQLTNGSYKRMPYITNSSSKQVSVRDIAEQHVIDDLGIIPTLQDSMKGIELTTDNAGGIKKLKLNSVPYLIVD
jgi:hypothetical protein